MRETVLFIFCAIKNQLSLNQSSFHDFFLSLLAVHVSKIIYRRVILNYRNHYRQVLLFGRMRDAILMNRTAFNNNLLELRY